MIPFIDLQAQYRKIEHSVRRRMDAVFKHGQFIMGPEIAELETALNGYVGVKNTISCSSGSDALVMALMALDVGPGDCVFAPAMTFIATTEAIERVGAQIRFVDVDPRTFNLDPTDLEKQILAAKKYTQGSRPAAIIPVNLFGVCADFEAIDAIAKKHGLHVIEDAAQSFGATYRGKKSGALSRISCTSFFPAKPLGCYGDGGAVFTPDDDLATRLRSLRVHGQGKERYHHVQLGLTARLDTLQAAVLLAKLEIFENEIVERNRIAAEYSKRLGALSPAPIVPFVPKDTRSAWAQYSVLFPSSQTRDAARKKLEGNGIPNVIYYPIPLHMQPVYSKLGYKPDDFPNSRKMADTILSVPMHPYLESGTIQTVCDSIQEVLKNG